MTPHYLEAMPSSLSTITDAGLVEALHDLAEALDTWRKQTAAEDFYAMENAGALLLDRLKTAANAAITVAASESASR